MCKVSYSIEEKQEKWVRIEVKTDDKVWFFNVELLSGRICVNSGNKDGRRGCPESFYLSDNLKHSEWQHILSKPLEFWKDFFYGKYDAEKSADTIRKENKELWEDHIKICKHHIELLHGVPEIFYDKVIPVLSIIVLEYCNL